jgi:hypothetical protein
VHLDRVFDKGRWPANWLPAVLANMNGGGSFQPGSGTVGEILRMGGRWSAVPQWSDWVSLGWGRFGCPCSYFVLYILPKKGVQVLLARLEFLSESSPLESDT